MEKGKIKKSITERYRPKVMEDIIGNEKIVESINRMININDIDDMIFYGTYGVGKTTMGDVIGRKILNNFPTGYMYFNASQMTRKDVIYERVILDSRAKIKGYKLIVLDEAENVSDKGMMQLKTWLEKKNSNIIVIFIVNDYRKIPGAIKDRCANYKYKKIPDNLIYNRIKQICKLENINFTDKKLKQIAEISNGSVRKAIRQLNTGDFEDEDNELDFDKIFDLLLKKKTKDSYKELYKLFEDYEDSIVIDELFNFVYSKGFNLEDIYLNIAELEKDIITGCSIYTSSMKFAINTKKCITKHFNSKK